MPLTVNSRYAGLPIFDALDAKGVSHPTVAMRRPVALAPGTAVYQHLVSGVETIEYLAWRYYGDSRMWWKIADANDLIFPLDIGAGMTLTIPGARDVGTIVRNRSFGVVADDVPNASVKIEGIDMAATVESVDVEDHDQAIDRAKVVFDDSQAVVCQIIREQSKVQISLGWNSENAFIFEGVVIAVKTEAMGMARQRVTLTAYDLSYMLKQGPPKKRAPFTSGKLSDALKKILADYATAGIAVGDITPDPDPTFTALGPTLVKKEAQSDWDFIQEQARKYRCRAFVEVNGGKSKFYFVSEKSLLKGDPMGTLFYCPNGTGKLTEFKYQRVGSSASPAPTATVIDPQTGDPVTKQVAPPDPEAPLKVDDDADQQTKDAGDTLGKAAGKPEEQRPTPIVSGQASDPVGVGQKLQQDPTRILGFYGTGVAVGTVKLRAKGKVTINGLAPWAEGDWYVHKVNHIFQRSVVTDAKLKERDRSTYKTRLSVTR